MTEEEKLLGAVFTQAGKQALDDYIREHGDTLKAWGLHPHKARIMIIDALIKGLPMMRTYYLEQLNKETKDSATTQQK